MKQLFLKCFLLFFLVGGIIYGGGLAFRQTNTYINLESTEDTERFHAVPSSIDVAVFGASHGRNAFPEFPGADSFFNFSLSSQTPQYDEKMMLQYSDRFEDGALIILTVMYTSPFREESTASFMRKQPRYYRILDAENIVDVDLSRYWLQRFSPILTQDITALASAFLGNVSLISNPFDAARHKSISVEAMEGEQARIMRDHVALLDATFPETASVSWEAYCRMLTMCRENNWKAVLVTPPYLEEYNACFPEEFFPIYYETMEELSSTFHVPYLNYSHDEFYAGKYGLFQDIDHLNAEGSAVFFMQIQQDLQTLGLL